MYKNVNEIPGLPEMIQAGYITARPHPTVLLVVYNYTPKAQYENVWNEATLQCRGLIAEADGRIIARPFSKFFNWDQVEKLPDGPYTVTEKMDGSLGIAYYVNGFWRIATRGSFTSDQAVRASTMLELSGVFRMMSPEVTYLFEIIYPENRVVVNYGAANRLVLLAAIRTDSGWELPLSAFPKWGFDVVKEYPAEDVASLVAKNIPNHEGFVLRYATGERIKVKFEDYKRLHRVLTGVTAKNILEDYLIPQLPLYPLLERVPDEFSGWLKDTVADLYGQFDAHVGAACVEYAKAVAELGDSPRKEYARLFVPSKYRPVLFNMMDGKDTRELLWSYVVPKKETFKVDAGG